MSNTWIFKCDLCSRPCFLCWISPGNPPESQDLYCPLCTTSKPDKKTPKHWELLSPDENMEAFKEIFFS